MTPPAFSEIELALTSAALSGDAGALYRVAAGLMDDGIPFDSVLFDYLMPAESALGDRWQVGDYLVAEEHVATATIETVVSLLAGMLDHPSAGNSVVVATAEGDNHSLAARAVAAHLLFLGFRTTYLGANVLGSDLGEFLETEPPSAVILSCAMTSYLLGARAVIEAAHSVGVPVIAGGAGFGDTGQWAGAVGADAWVASPREVADRLEQWQTSPQDPTATATPLPSELVELIPRRAAVIAAAEAEMNRQGPLVDRLRDEVPILLGAVEASLLVGEEQPLIEMLEWQDSSLTAYGFEPSLVAGALETALTGISGQAAELLGRCREAL